MHAFIVPIRSLRDHTPLPGKPIWLPGPLPWRDPTRSPYPKASELMGEAGAWPSLGRYGSLERPGANQLGELEQHSGPV